MATSSAYFEVSHDFYLTKGAIFMPANTNISALRIQIKLGLLREAYRQKLLSEQEFTQLMKQHRAS